MKLFRSRFGCIGWLALALTAPAWVAAQAPAPQPVPARPAHGGFLGVGIQDVNGDRARELKLPGDSGVEITRVRPESPAEMAGLKPGDVVLQYNGAKVESIQQLSRMVMETPPGHDAKIDIFRGGATQTVTAKIGQPPAPGWPPDVPYLPSLPDVPRIIQGMRSPMLGVEAESIDGQLAQFFGVKDNGVLVRSVIKDSAAEKAGIKAGDVIVRVEDAHTATPADISAKLRGAGGKQVSVTLVREKKETTLSVIVEQPSERLGRTGRAQLLDSDQ